MFKLMLELSLCALVVVLALLYVRDQCRDLKAKTREWLRMQRMVIATRVAGPSAIPKTKPKVAQPNPKPVPAKAQQAPRPAPVVSAVPSIVDTLDIKRLEIPTCLRQHVARPLAETGAKAELPNPSRGSVAGKVSAEPPLSRHRMVRSRNVTAANSQTPNQPSRLPVGDEEVVGSELVG